jgi:hypothetical protein
LNTNGGGITLRIPSEAFLLDATGGLAFAGFLLLALVVRAAEGGPRRRNAVHALLGYLLAVSLLAGLGQRDLWPFSNWKLAAGRVAPAVTRVRVVAVDEAGAEHRIDYRAWQPLAYDELAPWLETVFPSLDEAGREGAARFLLGRAEAARRRSRDGGRPGTAGRWLGPLAAPYFVQHPRRWTSAEATPPWPFVGLRLYRESWTLEERRREPGHAERVLVYEYPRR